MNKKIVCLSDTHGYHKQIEVPDGDIVVFCGDLTGGRGINERGQVGDFLRWYSALPHKHKVMIAGNHDFELEKVYYEDFWQVSKAMGIDYLFDSGVEIEGLKFWGSPWQPEFHNWAFNLPRGHRLRVKWDLIPKDTNVLLTHGPPAYILDLTRRGEHAGCKDLLARLAKLPDLKLHAFGHIHESYGKEYHNNLAYVNASIWDHINDKLNEPQVLELRI